MHSAYSARAAVVAEGLSEVSRRACWRAPAGNAKEDIDAAVA